MTIKTYGLVRKVRGTMFGHPVCYMLSRSRIKHSIGIRTTGAARNRKNYQSSNKRVERVFSYVLYMLKFHDFLKDATAVLLLRMIEIP